MDAHLHGTLRNVEEFDAAVYLEGVQTRDGSVAWSLYGHVEDRKSMTTTLSTTAR